MLRVSRIADGRYDVDDVLQRTRRGAFGRCRQGSGALRAAQHRRPRRRRRLRRSAARGDASPARARAGDSVHQLAAVGARDQGRAAPRLRARRQPLRFGRRGDAVRRARQRRAAREARRLRGRAVPRLPAARPAGAAARGDAERRRGRRLRAAAEAVAQRQPAPSARAASRSSIRPRRTLLQVGSVEVQIDELRPLERLARAEADRHRCRRTSSRARDGAGQVNLLLAPRAGVGERARRVRRLRAAVPAADERRRSAPAAPRRRGAARRRRCAAAPPWRVSRRGAGAARRPPRLARRDDRARAAALALADFSLSAEKIAWPLAAPVLFRGEGRLGAGRRARQARVLGPGRHGAARRVKVSLAALPLTPLRPYLRERRSRCRCRRAERRGRCRLARRRRRAALARRRVAARAGAAPRSATRRHPRSRPS